ncbi:MAG: CoA transferase [Acidimicrobiales bacterium]|nr:CoA transferase [Acidimicrobiales bacterium]
MKPALDGLPVLDIATVLAAPGCARHLADFGADTDDVLRDRDAPD